MEQSLLGCLLIDKDAIIKIADIITADDFYKDSHRLIFEAMKGLYEKREPIDLLSLSSRLGEEKQLEIVGGRSYLTSLANAVPTSSHVVHYAQTVQSKATLRRMIKAASEIAELGYQETEEISQLLDRSEQKLFGVSQKYLKRTFIPITDVLTETFDRIDELHRDSGKLRGIPTYFSDLDNILAGLQKSDLIIIAARPSMGKCLGKGTNVLMYDGTLKKVEDILVGDLLMGNDSTPRKVLSLARGKEMMYWIRQLHGIDYRVNESHILSLKRSRNEGLHQHGSIVNIEVREYLKQSSKWKSYYKGYKTAVDFEYLGQSVSL